MALVLAIMALMLLTFLGLTLATTTSTELQIATNYRWSQQALYNAEAGIEAAKAILRSMPVGTSWATLLPIAAGYLIAHYLTLLIQGIVWLPKLLANPLLTVAPPLDWIPVSVVWYLSVGAIVVGHIVAVYVAHVIALRELPDPRRALRSQYPMLALMVGYTMVSLWILAQPIVETGAGE